MAHIDLSRYLARIGYSGAPAPTLETLRAIVLLHIDTIPFENLDPFLGKPVSLDIAEVERKLVTNRRGGYCFEQNLLLWEALRALGFNATGLAARVLWMRSDRELAPRSHMPLRVAIGGRDYLADVGFGGLTLAGVLELRADVEQTTAHESFRLSHTEGDWRMQARLSDEWHTLYRFDLQPQYPVDYLAYNYFVATHPTSPFVTGLKAARTTADARYALHNREFSIYRRDAAPQRRLLGNEDIATALGADFGIAVPDRAHLLRRLESLP